MNWRMNDPEIAPIDASTMLTTKRPAKITIITPKTVQPCPRTSSRLRESAASAPGVSNTTTGAVTDQIVSRIRPGTIRNTSPTPTPRPATSPATSSCPSTGVTEANSSPSDASTRPSCTSCTVLATMPAYQTAAPWLHSPSPTTSRPASQPETATAQRAQARHRRLQPRISTGVPGRTAAAIFATRRSGIRTQPCERAVPSGSASSGPSRPWSATRPGPPP